MKKLMKAVTALMLTVSLFFVTGCNKENNDSDVRVTTYTPQDITQTTAKCGGDVIVTQGLSLSELGVCWSESRNPTVEDSHLSTTNWSEPYVCTITGLAPGTSYHVRAYALRGLEYYYGNDKSFTTEENGGVGGGNSGGNGTYNGHAYVDFGLPSGTLWATCNVGATTPEGYGDYFAWGETTPKEYYAWSTYKYCNGGNGWNTLTKYCNDATYGYNGFTDNLTVLQPMDDAATANWGSGWRTPTKEQWQELIDNITSTVTFQNGVCGMLFTASNGRSLFLPQAGRRWDVELLDAGSLGHYWSSLLNTDDPSHALDLFFRSGLGGVLDSQLSYRSHGFSVRPVRAN